MNHRVIAVASLIYWVTLAQVQAAPLNNTMPLPTSQPVEAQRQVPRALGAMGKPLMVLRFNQHHVDYEHQLSRAVQGALRRRPDATYDVVSLVPAGVGSKDQPSRLNSDAGSNLDNVVQFLQNEGVATWHIRTSAKASSEVQTQEIRIYIN